MPKHFLLESFEKHKNLGIRCFNTGDVREAKYHFLKAAEYLLELARQSDPDLRKVRIGISSTQVLGEVRASPRSSGVDRPGS